MNIALTIAGSDSSGGAGIQADIKSITCLGVYAASVITALTAQNTQGVQGVLDVSCDFVEAQIDSVFTDLKVDSVKIGMLSNSSIIKSVAKKLKEHKAKNIVLDPVMVSTSGSRLISEDAISTLKSELFPLSLLITPNIPEAEVLTGLSIKRAEDMQKAGEVIFKEYGVNVLVKGGHNLNDANDVLVSKNGAKWFNGKRINNSNTHGTGCTLSSSIAALLAKGLTLEEAIKGAKEYLANCLAAMLDIGKGRGPVMHNYSLVK